MAISNLHNYNERMKKKAEKIGIRRILAGMFIPLSLIYYEVLLKILTGQHFLTINTICFILTSLAAGCILTLIASLTRLETLNKWIGFIFVEAIALVFLLSYFVYDSFKVFNDIQTIAQGAGGIATEFGSTVLNVIKTGLGTIALYEIPALLFILLFFILRILSFKKRNGRYLLLLLICFLIFEAAGLVLMMRNENSRRKLTRNYGFDPVTTTYSLQTAYKLDALYLIFGNPFKSNYELGLNYLDPDNLDAARYGQNEQFLDLSDYTANKYVQKTDQYVASLTPSSKNVYTGLFKGKNLIFITAESLSTEAIREDLTPTLYRLKTKGIVFEDFYQPYYNSSTATGELANLTGLVPTAGMRSFTNTIDNQMYLTIGNEMLRQGSTNIAYHNGTVEYYKRFLTHVNFGYPTFIAQGNGMEEGLSGTWPESDLEMFQYSVPQYIGQTPFSIYYMTLTAHFPYFKDLSVMTERYGDMVENLAYSDVVEAYLTDMIDLDKAIEYLVNELEKAGIADDTVIVISPDHYAYGLTESDAFGTDANYLPELFGYDPHTLMERDHNSLIIWCKELEKQAPIKVSEPVYSVDILPTLLNLFDLEYDSRLLAGRDVFSDALPLVIWPDYSWLTDKGYYQSSTDTFTPNNGVTIPDEYVETIQSVVSNKMVFSSLVLEEDYYRHLFP